MRTTSAQTPPPSCWWGWISFRSSEGMEGGGGVGEEGGAGRFLTPSSSFAHSDASTPPGPFGWKRTKHFRKEASPKQSRVIRVQEATPLTPPPRAPPERNGTPGNCRRLSLLINATLHLKLAVGFSGTVSFLALKK